MGHVGVGGGPFDSPPMDSYELPVDMVYLLPFSSYSSVQKRSFSAVRPSVRPGYDDKYRSKSYRFVDEAAKTFTTGLSPSDHSCQS